MVGQKTPCLLEREGGQRVFVQLEMEDGKPSSAETREARQGHQLEVKCEDVCWGLGMHEEKIGRMFEDGENNVKWSLCKRGGPSLSIL